MSPSLLSVCVLIERYRVTFGALGYAEDPFSLFLYSHTSSEQGEQTPYLPCNAHPSQGGRNEKRKMAHDIWTALFEIASLISAFSISYSKTKAFYSPRYSLLPCYRCFSMEMSSGCVCLSRREEEKNTTGLICHTRALALDT